MKFNVYRLDENPKNYTYGQWCFVCSFETEDCATAFVQRASTPTQKLCIRREER